MTDNLTQYEKVYVRDCVKENGSVNTYQSVTGNEPDSGRQQPGQVGQPSEPMFPPGHPCPGLQWEEVSKMTLLCCPRSTAVRKASGRGEIPAELCKPIKEDVIKDLHSLCQQIWKTTGQEKSILIPIAKKGNTKECANHQTVALISHASKAMLKILHARL